MNASTDILRGELERLFELDEMKHLSSDLLGFDPEAIGGIDGGKGAFARALVAHCADEDALEALADAILFTSRERGARERISKIFDGGAGPELGVGTEIEGFRIMKKLGEGALGVVYLGERKNEEAGTKDRAALKVIKQTHARDRAAVRRYLTVTRALRAHGTEGFAPILGVGELDDGRPWVATRFVEGQSLGARISRVGPMHFNEARPIVVSLLQTLEELHERGVVHGDVKTENVFIVRPTREDGTRGEPTGVLVDGGVDRLIARGNGLLSVSGTSKALDPQLAGGNHPSPASDLYATATLLYEVLCGRPPFVGDNALTIIAQHLTVEPDPPSTHAPRGWIPEELDAVVLRALAKDPKDRFGSAKALIDVLESVGRASRVSRAPATSLDAAAFDAAKAALLESPDSEEKAVAVERVVEPAHAWDVAVETFEAAAEAASDVEVKKSLLFRAARINESEREDRDAAEAVYRKIVEIDPTDEIALVALEELKRGAGAYEDLAELLLEKAEREEDPTARAATLREIAQIYDQHLDSPDNAFVAWTQALADDPTDERTVRAVERLAGKDTNRWNEVIASITEAAQGAEPSAAVPLYVMMGDWYAKHLSRPDFAVTCYDQARAQDPSNQGAFDGTVRLYRKSQSWKELVELLTTRADKTDNPARARDLRADAAVVVHRKLADTDRAAELFRQVLENDPAHPVAADALEEILTEKKKWKELVALLEKRAKNEPEDKRLATLVHVGELYEDRLDNAEKAQVSYESAVAHDAGHVLALKGLERLYAKTGKHDKLLDVLEKQLAAGATPRQRIALLERIGGIQEEEFVNHEAAAHAYEQIVEVEPGHEASNAALARIYRQMQRFDDLAETLDRHAKSASDDARKIELLLAEVKVLQVDVGAPERAMAVVERILGIDPEHADGLELMARLKAATGDAAAAISATDRLAEAERDGVKKADLWVRAGRMLEDKGDKDGAIERYKRALDADPESADAASALRAIYYGRGDAHGAVELLQRELAVTEGAISKAKLYAEMGELYRERLERPTEARVAFEKALELDPTCTPASRGLSEMAFETSDYKNAARFSEPLLARTSEMPPDVAKQISLLCGDAFKQLDDFSKAQRAYLNAKAFAPDDREVLERVADVTYESGEPDEAAELYRDIYRRFGGQLSGGDKGRILFRLGEATRRAGGGDDAIPFLNEAAELMPEDPAPLESLAQLHEDAGKWELVVRTYRRRMEVASDEERFTLLVRVGDVLLDKMGDRQKASKSYVAALEVKPDDRNLLTKLMAVYSESKDWSRLVEVILRIAELVDDPRQLSKYYNTAAAIAHRELGRLDEAADYYEQALENDPSLEAAFQGMIECLGQKQDYLRLSEAYKAHLERTKSTAPPETRARLYDSLAEILQHRMDKVTDAVDAYEQAQELDPGNRRRAEQLAEIYGSDPKRYYSRAVAMHGSLLAMSPYRVESYQALRRLYTDIKKPDESWCVCQALTVLNMAEPDEQSFFKKHRARTPAAAQEFFTEEIWFNHILHTDQDPLLTGIFRVITPAVVATRAQGLETFGVGPNDLRDPETDEAAMAQMLHYAAGVAQIALPDVYYRASDPGGLSFITSNPPAIGLGQGALAGGPSQALAFVAGRHLAYFRGGFYLRHLVPTGSGLRAWLLAAIKTSQPKFPVPGDLGAPVQKAHAALEEHLTAQGKDELHSLVQKLLTASPSLDMKKWVAAIDLSADRVGFVLSNDLEIATAVVRASPEEAASVGQKERLKELHLFSVSREYLELRHKLGVAIGS